MLPLALSGVSISFPGLAQPVLSIDELAIPAGGRLAVTGASGSGKSTFVNLVSGLERPDSGAIRWRDTDITTLSESRRDRWRAANVGLVMQEFHLFPGLAAIDNVLLPARLARAVTAEVKARAHELLARVGLTRPSQPVETMSRGEMQRVAVARALLRRPGVIIADEPTASLDAEAGAEVGRLLIELADQEGATLIVISHDERLTERLDRRIRLATGQVVADTAEEVSP
ncbi:ABC transporter [Pleomorphomonas diazotrophica]|uniref:ABC transporter n=1 Tax=Pleomorphomonas diazotrophica TaxID=1166257 RepID=A0A1I4S9X4_9HYPH|nr:ATP-binding cassette domain-containing protein [Pleomorphomonas diazotrophica]PKR88795.1 ABC transporter [Pleomorphomonas diazotrophica]SFM61285.1 putative ABC transport system ATP-binding protein [Pleomorphomonas diazotrophica]